MHTEGKLNTQGVHIFDEDNRQVCTVIGDFSDYEKTKNTSRRLVACWNACDGIDTEDLEHGNKYCEQPMLQRGLQNMKALDLIQERDELVKALRKSACVGLFPEEDFNEISSILAKYSGQP